MAASAESAGPAALSLGDHAEAVHVIHPDDEQAARDFLADRERGIPPWRWSSSTANEVPR
ncbi:hypothetical protein [Amycolatopsis lurida]|uniref:Uncharacterized protein n=1 Tax=Amycolatopsis lurida NRRL 2430 TaxID=1460371 RepID=A0A2P2FI34_AMYLU|nr:hypothetical protein [Amycolatopsis lurida]KFU76364.1 hypothetical protein BB31_36575 [Amycolatopsis lurida NRRL 2430]